MRRFPERCHRMSRWIRRNRKHNPGDLSKRRGRGGRVPRIARRCEEKRCSRRSAAAGLEVADAPHQGARGKNGSTQANKRFLEIAAGAIRTPVYLLDESLIEENMRVMRYVKDRTGCKILHALKAYASFATFPMMADT